MRLITYTRYKETFFKVANKLPVDTGPNNTVYLG